MSDRRTLGSLWKAGQITRADLDAIVEAYLENPAASRLPVTGRYVVDVAAAVTARPISRRTLADKTSEDSVRATAVLNAIVLAVPHPADP